MKKFIAAALSILVGAFGYTIVDSTIEDRVSRLESEVYELREKVSDYHNENNSSESSDEQDGIYVGKKFKDAGSCYKFLIRIHNDGRAEYISPQNYAPRNDATIYFASFDETFAVDLRDPRETTTGVNLEDPRVPVDTSRTFPVETSEDDYQTTEPRLLDPRETTRPNQWTTGWYEEKTTYYSSSTPGDYFVYLSKVSAVITDSSVENSLYYDADYSLATKALCSDFTFTITYQGKTNPALAGEKIRFATQFFDGYIPSAHYGSISVGNNIINADGSFSYTETYKIYRSDFYTDFLPFINFNYSVQSVELY